LELRIGSLTKRHRRQDFYCNEPSLDQYIQQYALQDVKRNLTRVFVASTAEDESSIAGYYTLSASSVEVETLPAAVKQRLPKYPLPVAILGRLAVAQSLQGQGIGTILLADALKRVSQASQIMAVYAVVVDALNENAKAFYQQFGFIPFPQQTLRLFLPIDTIFKLVE